MLVIWSASEESLNNCDGSLESQEKDSGVPRQGCGILGWDNKESAKKTLHGQVRESGVAVKEFLWHRQSSLEGQGRNYGLFSKVG